MEGHAPEVSTSVAGAELRLIPEFGGSGSQEVVEWLDKAASVCICAEFRNRNLLCRCVLLAEIS